MAHTPGPWTVERHPHSGHPLVAGANSLVVTDCLNDAIPVDEAEANARLISLAPEMLEALEKLLEACEHEANRTGGDFGPIIGPAAEVAESLIARACGAEA